MTAHQNIKKKIILDYLEEYKEYPSHTLAKMIYFKYPEYWNSTETIRTNIRLYRGKLGDLMRNKNIQNKKYYVTEQI
jgi:hypothetical protein